jgi:hypothetical protein
MSTSEFVGALDSDTLHFPAKGWFFCATTPCLQIERGVLPVILCSTCEVWSRTLSWHELNTRAMAICHTIASGWLHQEISGQVDEAKR